MHAAIRASDRCHPTPMCVSDPVTRLRPHSQQPRMTPSPVKPQTSMAAYAVEMHVCGRCGVYCASRIAPCVAHAGHAHGLLPAMICVSRRQLLSQVAPHAAAFAQSTRLRGEFRYRDWFNRLNVMHCVSRPALTGMPASGCEFGTLLICMRRSHGEIGVQVSRTLIYISNGLLETTSKIRGHLSRQGCICIPRTSIEVGGARISFVTCETYSGRRNQATIR